VNQEVSCVGSMNTLGNEASLPKHHCHLQ